MLVGPLDRGLQQGVHALHDGDDQGRQGRPAARPVRRRTPPRRAGRPGARRSATTARRPSIRLDLAPSSAKDIPRERPGRDPADDAVRAEVHRHHRPERPSSKSLSNGDVIPASRVRTNVELQKILADLFPLLRSIRPGRPQHHPVRARHALRGRGDADRRDPRQAGQLPDDDQRAPADAAAGPRPALAGSARPTRSRRPTWSGSCATPPRPRTPSSAKESAAARASSPTSPGWARPRRGS